MLAIVSLSLLLLSLAGPIHAADPINVVAPNPIRRNDVARNASELEARHDGHWYLETQQAHTGPLWDKDKGAHYSDVDQGANGDCWLLAGAASLAYVGQDHLRSIIHDQVNIAGSVDVTLHISADETKVYTVQKPSKFELGMTDKYGATWRQTGTYLWPVILEKAIQALANDQPQLGIAKNLDGGYTTKFYEAIYGRYEFWRAISDLKEEELIPLLLTSHPTAVSVARRDDQDKFTKNGLPVGHAYTVINYDQGSKTVTLRNPWAAVSANSWGITNSGGKGVKDLGAGVFEISLQDFRDTFYDICGM